MAHSNRWPKYMPVPTAKDFIHGVWAADTEGSYYVENLGYVDALTPKELEAAGCGTKCCLVGHVRHAFGLPADVANDLPRQGDKFLDKFVELAGYPPRKSYMDAQEHASNCFEGIVPKDPDDDPWGPKYPQLTEQKAAKVWKKTLEHFGYTEIV